MKRMAAFICLVSMSLTVQAHAKKSSMEAELKARGGVVLLKDYSEAEPQSPIDVRTSIVTSIDDKGGAMDLPVTGSCDALTESAPEGRASLMNLVYCVIPNSGWPEARVPVGLSHAVLGADVPTIWVEFNSDVKVDVSNQQINVTLPNH